MATIAHYDVGDRWTPQATFTVGGTPTDPTNLTVRQQAPDGTETVLANAVTVSGLTGASTPVAKVSTGVFKLNPGISLNAAGYWFVRFEGTGTAEAAEEFQAIADPSEFTTDGGVSARALVTLAETKDYLQQNQINTGEDLEIVRVINDISDRFHEVAMREFKVVGTNPQTRTFTILNRGVRSPRYIDGQYVGEFNEYNRRVKVGDMAAAPTAVTITDTDWTTLLETVTVGNWNLIRDEKNPFSGPIRYLEFGQTVASLSPGMRVNVTGNFGFPSIPGSVRQAVLDAIAETLDRDVEHYRQSLEPVQSTEGSNVVVVGNAGPRVVSLPPRALAVAWSYRDITVA